MEQGAWNVRKTINITLYLGYFLKYEELFQIYFLCVDDAVLPPGGTKLHMYAKMNNLNLRLCNKDYNFAELNVKGKLFIDRNFMLMHHYHLALYNVIAL